MRRLLKLLFILTGLVLAVILLRWMSRRQSSREHERARGAPDRSTHPIASVVELTSREPAEYQTSGRSTDHDVVDLRREMVPDHEPDSVETRRRRMAEARVDMAERISHGVLFGMAHERGVSHGLVVASRWDLLDAILRVERLRAEDAEPTVEHEERLRALLGDAELREAKARADALAKEAERTIDTRPRERRRQGA